MIRRLRPRSRAWARDERGLALAEVLIAIAIIGLSLTVLVGSYATGIRSTRRHEGLTYANVASGLVAEWVAGQQYSDVASYAAPSASDVTYPPGWGPSNVSLTTTCWVEVTDPPQFAGCTADTRLQKIQISLSGDGFARSLEILKRKPS